MPTLPEKLLRETVRPAVAKLVRRAMGRPEPVDPHEEALRTGRLTMGRHTYGRPQIHVYTGDTAVVRIGAFCSIAADVEIFVGGNHLMSWVSTFPLRAQLGLPGAYEDGHPATRGDVAIGHDVWLARGAKILSGVTIGHGAVVGAYTVVARDVPPYGIAVGNPMTVVRKRFSDDQIEALLSIAWWDWPEDRVRKAAPELNGGSIDDFIRKHRQGLAK